MEKLISKYIILLPFFMGLLQVMKLPGFHYANYLLILLCVVIFFANLRFINRQKYGMIKFTILYMVLVWIHEILAGPTPKVLNPYNKTFYFVFLLVGLAFWVLGYKKYNLLSQINKIAIAVIIYASLLFGYYQMIIVGGVAAVLGGEDEKVMFLYQVLPYLLLWITSAFFIFKRPVQLSIVGLFIIVILISSKRGPLVSMVAGFACILILQHKIKISQIILLLFAGAILYFIITKAFEAFLGDWMSRWEEKEDVSNGRSVIWAIILYEFVNNGIFSIIFGNGFEATHQVTYNYWSTPIGAHNDFIDILYNFGLVGFTLFVMLFISWIRYVFYALKVNYEHAAMMIYLLACFGLGSIVSSNMTRFATAFFGVFFYYFAGQLSRYAVEMKKKQIINNVNLTSNENNSVHTCQGREQVNTPEEH